MTTATLMVSAIGIYVVFACAVGIWSSRKAKDESGFLVAGRSLGPILGGATLMANQVSAGTTVGIVGFHYFSGISFAWTWPLTWIGWMVAAFFVAPQMRKFAGMTLSDFLAVRFQSESIRVLASVLILIGYAFLLSAQYQAGGLIFGAVTGMTYGHAVLLVASISFVYTVLGGMFSNAYIGLFKAAILVAAYSCVIPFLLRETGGLHALAGSLYAIDPRLTGGWFSVRQLIALSLAVGLGTATAPYEITAFYSLSSQRVTRLAIGYSFLFQAFVAVGVLVCGLATRNLMPYLTNPDLAVPTLSLYLLPAWMGVLLLLAVVVTLTRTGGALLLTSASSFSHDVYLHFLRSAATEREKLAVHRVMIGLLALAPIGIAMAKLDLVNFVILFAVKFLASAFFAPVVLGLNWSGGTRAGAVASMILGPTAVVTWAYFQHPTLLALEAAEAGLLANTIGFIVVSLATNSSSHTYSAETA
ncbi:MAG TPA: sodium:solute symporter family protein [Bryobacteraceae bacterium]|nr:sodium:solute symporter family protein [Bryobacteraceae bacterium]